MLRSITWSVLLLVVSTPDGANAFSRSSFPDREAEEEYPWLRRNFGCKGDRSGPTTADFASKILHQIWWQGEADVPSHFKPLQASWSKHHPGWQHRIWDEAAIMALVDSETYAWFAPTFHALPSKVQKVDAARYLILHAEGGLYADLDVESFQPIDEVLDAPKTRSHLIFFEEPATHWKAYDTIVSNGMIASPKGHPLLIRLLKSVRPVEEVFQSGGSHMLQRALERCHAEQLGDVIAQDGIAQCGCYVTKSSKLFFPVHEGMHIIEEYTRPGEHADSLRIYIRDVAAGSWPPISSYTAQYYTVSWIDPEIGKFYIEGLQAARSGDSDLAESLFLATMWSRWGTRLKYRNHPDPPALDRAEKAYERALAYQPTYGFPYYELGNLQLEASGRPSIDEDEKASALAKAEAHFTAAVSLSPTSLLFTNNLGVAQLNLGKAEESVVSFQKVLRLHATSFATIKGLDVEAGAHLNIGHALHTLGRAEEAHDHWLTALENGTFDYAKQAVQRMRAANATERLPSRAQIELRFGDALARAGRTREATVRFAAAYTVAPKSSSGDGNDEEVLTSEGQEIRSEVQERMAALAEVWHEGNGIPLLTSSRKRGQDASSSKRPPMEYVEAMADGSTKREALTQEKLAQIRAAAQPVG